MALGAFCLAVALLASGASCLADSGDDSDAGLDGGDGPLLLCAGGVEVDRGVILGDCELDTNEQIAQLEAAKIRRIAGSLILGGELRGDVELSCLEELDGSLFVSRQEGIERIQASSLREATSIRLSRLSSLESASFPMLSSLRGALVVKESPVLMELDVSSLVTAPSVTIESLPAIAVLKLGALRSVGTLILAGVPSLSEPEFACMEEVEELWIGGAGLETLAFPCLTRVSGDLSLLSNPVLDEISFPALRSIDGSLVLRECPLLPECVLAALLEQLVESGGSPASVETDLPACDSHVSP